jgi:hypothetical protein
MIPLAGPGKTRLPATIEEEMAPFIENGMVEERSYYASIPSRKLIPPLSQIKK